MKTNELRPPEMELPFFVELQTCTSDPPSGRKKTLLVFSLLPDIRQVEKSNRAAVAASKGKADGLNRHSTKYLEMKALKEAGVRHWKSFPYAPEFSPSKGRDTTFFVPPPNFVTDDVQFSPFLFSNSRPCKDEKKTLGGWQKSI